MLVKIENLTRKFISGNMETTALNDVSLTVLQSEFVAIMGPSGCGKSTLLNVLGLLDDNFTGSYFFENHEVSNLSKRRVSNLRSSRISFIFQNFNLIEHLTVYQNIELAVLYKYRNKERRHQLVEQAMEKVSVSHRQNHSPNVLSGGEQQRVAIARALVGSPSLILADEPTGNLDQAKGDEVMSLLSELNNSGTTVMMVTHSESQAAYAHRVLRLEGGNLISS